MIYNIIDQPKHRYTPEGTHYINTYQECLDDLGRLTLERTGQTNVYEKIQEEHEATKIESILHAVAMGDLEALKQREATYCDATTLPHSLREAQDLVIRLRDEFYNLPLEVRKEFSNSPEQYVSEMGTKEFVEKMAPYNEKILAISKEKSDKEYRKKCRKAQSLTSTSKEKWQHRKERKQNEQKYSGAFRTGSNHRYQSLEVRQIIHA